MEPYRRAHPTESKRRPRRRRRRRHGYLSMKEGRKAELTRVGTGSGRRDRGRGGGEDGPGGGGSRRVWWAKVARNGARAGSVLSFRGDCSRGTRVH